MLIFTLSFFQLQQEKFRVGLAELSKNFHLFMSCDRTAMFVLHVDTFKTRATFVPRSQAVKNKLWSLVVTGKYRSGTEFVVMNSSCYSCRESIKQLKLHKKYIYKKHYDRTSVNDISIFYPEIPLPVVFHKFKENLRALRHPERNI